MDAEKTLKSSVHTRSSSVEYNLPALCETQWANVRKTTTQNWSDQINTPFMNWTYKYKKKFEFTLTFPVIFVCHPLLAMFPKSPVNILFTGWANDARMNLCSQLWSVLAVALYLHHLVRLLANQRPQEVSSMSCALHSWPGLRAEQVVVTSVLYICIINTTAAEVGSHYNYIYACYYNRGISHQGGCSEVKSSSCWFLSGRKGEGLAPTCGWSLISASHWSVSFHHHAGHRRISEIVLITA